jgi:hypothetical protein
MDMSEKGNNTEKGEEEEDAIEVAIDPESGERIPVEELEVADNQDDENQATTETVVLEAAATTTTSENENEGQLTTNQILLGILDALNTRNKLAQEQNKRLRDMNRNLKRVFGYDSPLTRTLQGTNYRLATAINNKEDKKRREEEDNNNANTNTSINIPDGLPE